MACTNNRVEHDSIACLQRLRNHGQRRMKISGSLQGRDEHRGRDEQMISRVCYCIAAATDPSGLSWLIELAMTEDVRALPGGCPRHSACVPRDRGLESCLAATAEACSEEIMVVQQHLRPEEATAGAASRVG